MAVQYVNDFNGREGLVPLDFVITGQGAALCVNGKWHMVTAAPAGSVLQGILPSAKWLQSNGRATIYFTTSTPVGNIIPQVQLRTSGDWSAEVDSPNTGYKAIWISSNGLGVFKRTGGTTSQIGTFVPKPLLPATTYGMMLQVTGTNPVTLNASIWTGTWNGTWDFQQNDPGTTALIPGPGQCQIALLSQDPTPLTVDWDDLSLDDLVTVVTGPTPRLMRV